VTAAQFVYGDMACSPQTLVFSVPGKVASNNRNIRTYGKRGAVKGEDAVDYQARVAQYAMVATKQQGWKWIEGRACTVRIVHWNGLLDVDNACKVAIDSMCGIVYPDDRRRFVRGVNIVADADGGDERIDISVQFCNPLPNIMRKKCSVCLMPRPGLQTKPHICGRCRQSRNGVAA
jgi:hypothetical protein